LKIFDFGLCKELKDKDKTADGLYNLTGFTGALRYMAPEVGLGKPYTITADVYSWSMILWYMLALEPPLGLYSEKMIAERVFNKNYRPTVFKRWSDAIKEVMQASWNQDQALRPTFETVSEVIKKEIFIANSNYSLPPPPLRGHEGLLEEIAE
jgi:serine/threonine protein kinase